MTMPDHDRQLTVWIFQTGEPLPSDAGVPRPMRAMNLANRLSAQGHRVVIWSSAFFHQEKRHRSKVYERLVVNDAIEVRLIPSWGYQRNIGLGRLADHAQLAFNLRRVLRRESDAPDVGFVGYPPIEFAAVAVGWLRGHGVPVLLDAKDQWPDIFIDPFPARLRPLARLAFWPYYYLGRRAMRQSTALCSMTESFLAWMREFSGRAAHELDIVVPLSPASDNVPSEHVQQAVEQWAQRGVHQDGRRRFIFVGSLTQAFDFGPIREAAERARDQGLDWQFVVCGDGGAAAEVRGLFAGLDNVVLPGWIDRPQIVALSAMSAAGLAPYRNTADFHKSVPNKVIDYMSLGLPIVSPLAGEVQRLVERHGVGMIYDEHQPDSLFNTLLGLVSDAGAGERIGDQARSAYRDFFSAEISYGNLVERLERLSVVR